MIGDGRLQLTELTPGVQTWLAQLSANLRAVNDAHPGRLTGTSGAALNTLDVVALQTDGKFYKADSNGASPLFNAFGICLTTTTGADEVVIVVARGQITSTGHGLSLASLLYLSETAGSVTTTPPATPRIIGMVLDANTLWIDCPRSWAAT